MQSNSGQFHEVKPTGIHAPLREASTPNDATETKTRRGTASPLASAEQRLSAAPQVRGEGDSRGVSEAWGIAALHAPEADVGEVKRGVGSFEERGAGGAERPAVTAGYRGTSLETIQPLCTDPQPVS